MDLCSVLHGSRDGRGAWGRMDTRICVAESLCCPPETITAFLIDYTPVQNYKLQKKQRVSPMLKRKRIMRYDGVRIRQNTTGRGVTLRHHYAKKASCRVLCLLFCIRNGKEKHVCSSKHRIFQKGTKETRNSSCLWVRKLGFPGGAVVRLSMQETQATQVRSLGREDPLEKNMATHSSILAWEIPWTEAPVGYSSWGCKEQDL